MRRLLAGNVLGARVAKRRRVNPGQKMLSRSEQDRRDGKVHLVDEAGRETLADRSDSSAEPDVLTAGSVDRGLERGVNTVGHVLERGTAVHDDRRTSMMGENENRRVVRRRFPHQPFHVSSGQEPRMGPNMLRPRM